jgi:hypothetical protein
MNPLPIQESAANLDLSPRVAYSATVAASPTDGTETTVCSVTCPGDIAIVTGIIVMGWFAITIGTSGVSVNAKIRRTSAAGTTLQATGAVNEGASAATQLAYRYLQVVDTAPTMPGQVYVLTATVGSASAGSTVSAASLIAIYV